MTQVQGPLQAAPLQVQNSIEVVTAWDDATDLQAAGAALETIADYCRSKEHALSLCDSGIAQGLSRLAPIVLRSASPSAVVEQYLRALANLNEGVTRPAFTEAADALLGFCLSADGFAYISAVAAYNTFADGKLWSAVPTHAPAGLHASSLPALARLAARDCSEHWIDLLFSTINATSVWEPGTLAVFQAAYARDLDEAEQQSLLSLWTELCTQFPENILQADVLHAIYAARNNKLAQEQARLLAVALPDSAFAPTAAHTAIGTVAELVAWTEALPTFATTAFLMIGNYLHLAQVGTLVVQRGLHLTALRIVCTWAGDGNVHDNGTETAGCNFAASQDDGHVFAALQFLRNFAVPLENRHWLRQMPFRRLLNHGAFVGPALVLCRMGAKDAESGLLPVVLDVYDAREALRVEAARALASLVAANINKSHDVACSVTRLWACGIYLLGQQDNRLAVADGLLLLALLGRDNGSPGWPRGTDNGAAVVQNIDRVLEDASYPRQVRENALLLRHMLHEARDGSQK